MEDDARTLYDSYRRLRRKHSAKAFAKTAFSLASIYLIIGLLPEPLIRNIGFLFGPIYPGIFGVFIAAYFVSNFTFMILESLSSENQPNEKTTENEISELSKKYASRKLAHFITVSAVIGIVALPFDYSFGVHNSYGKSWTALSVSIAFLLLCLAIWSGKVKKDNSELVFIIGTLILYVVVLVIVMIGWGISDALDVVLDPGTGSGGTDTGGFKPHGVFCRIGRGCVYY